ncbi:PREDICTED: cytochrome P450 76C4-like [Ipomoea nil]|uniref:cytochrome P450 76C4-like n=1 Tax=Ipomoea nil TaxID=35883 RepID=UPI000901B4AC|nr:PREDICTED: cytochrome P450 76C4-like [Ipomoea nil]
MEAPTWIAYAAACLSTIALILLAKHLRRRKLHLPPGPKPWCIIGNLNLIGTRPHRSVHDLSLKYGPIMQLQFGSFPVVVGSSDLLAGGTENSTVIVEWAISELLKKPEIFKKATDELDHVIGQKRWVEEKDMPNLPYIQAIVKETMRLHPVAPMLVAHLCREDCKVAGYDIPKGTQVLVSVWTITRDPVSWDNPNEFIPDRFIGKDIDVKGCDFELLPFGVGRRMCLAYSLGLKVIQASLTNFLHGFNWKLPNDVTPENLNMDENIGLSTRKKISLTTVIEPRLPMHVYSH